MNCYPTDFVGPLPPGASYCPTVNLNQSPALTLATPHDYTGGACYGADFMGPLPPGSTYCVDSEGYLLNQDGSRVQTPAGAPTSTFDWMPFLYAGLAVIGLLAVMSIARGR